MNRIERPEEPILKKTIAPKKPYSWSEWDGFQKYQGWRARTPMSPDVDAIKYESRNTTDLTRRIEGFLRSTKQ